MVVVLHPYSRTTMTTRMTGMEWPAKTWMRVVEENRNGEEEGAEEEEEEVAGGRAARCEKAQR